MFTATGLDIVTNTRVEHLPETERKKHKSINPLHDFLGAAHDHAQSNNLPAIEAPPTTTTTSDNSASKEAEEGGASNKPRLTLEEYFVEPKDKSEYDGEIRVQCIYMTVLVCRDVPRMT